MTPFYVNDILINGQSKGSEMFNHFFINVGHDIGNDSVPATAN